MAKLTVTLKQHTPLIHFEHDVEGASLRATELKPKLDKFLLEEGVLGDDITQYLIKGQDKALDYKVKIRAKKEDRIDNLDINDFKLYFGNMGKGENKGFSFYKNIEVEFFSFKSEVIKRIEQVLPKFLFATNFGTRQSKGFGSFFINDKLEYIYNKASKFFDKEKIELITKCKYKFELKTNNIKEVFKNIDIFYKSLRSGINRCNPYGKTFFYCKPTLFYYANSLNYLWDKKNIKKNFLDISESSNSLVKEILGFSSEEMWRSYYEESTATNDIVQTLKVNKEIKEIDRYRSPVTFKIIKNKDRGDYDIFLVYDTKKVLNGKKIKISYNRNSIKGKNRKNEKKAEKYLENKNNKGIVIPKDREVFEVPNNVSIEEFLDFSFNKKKCAFIDKIEKKYKNENEYQVLNEIYGQLQKQVINNA